MSSTLRDQARLVGALASRALVSIPRMEEASLKVLEDAYKTLKGLAEAEEKAAKAQEREELVKEVIERTVAKLEEHRQMENKASRQADLLFRDLPIPPPPLYLQGLEMRIATLETKVSSDQKRIASLEAKISGDQEVRLRTLETVISDLSRKVDKLLEKKP